MNAVVIVLVALLAVSISVNVSLLLTGEKGTESDGDAYKPYDLIFNGKVVEVGGGPGRGDETVTFNITRFIKQDYAVTGLDLGYDEPIDVVSDGDPPHCFFDFEEDGIYTVYSRLLSGSLVTNACWGTHPYGRGGEFLLDPAIYPVTFESERSTRYTNGGSIILDPPPHLAP